MKRVVYARRGGLEAIEIIEEKEPQPSQGQVLDRASRSRRTLQDLHSYNR
mgnify:CR=1 FL=1